MNQPDTFPITGTGMNVPLRAVLRHQAQAVANYGLPVHALAERGGLDWRELYAVLSDVPYTEKIAGLAINVVRKYAMQIIERESVVTAQLPEGQASLGEGRYMREVTRYD